MRRALDRYPSRVVPLPVRGPLSPAVTRLGCKCLLNTYLCRGQNVGASQSRWRRGPPTSPQRALSTSAACVLLVGAVTRACRDIDLSLLGGISNPNSRVLRTMSEGDFKLELENATPRRLLELAATGAARRDSAEKLQRLIRNYSGSYWRNCITG
jgi:hypothetical protein